MLKLLLTNLSDCEAYQALVRDFAVPFPGSWRSPLPLPEAPSRRIPPAGMVRGLWQGLGRTHPGTEFPGLPDCSRFTALQAAGWPYAWPLDEAAVRLALTGAVASHAGLGVSVRNRAVFSPGRLKLQSAASCSCGTTWFSAHGQLTVRPGSALFMARVPDPAAGARGLPPEIECYQADGTFHGAVRLEPDASADAVEDWRGALESSGTIG